MSDENTKTEETEDTDTPLSLSDAFEKSQEESVFAGTPDEDTDEFEGEPEDVDKTSEVDEDEKDGKEEKSEFEDDIKFKYASQEEAESAVQTGEKRITDARTKMHEALQESAELRKEIKTLQKTGEKKKDATEEVNPEKDLNARIADRYAKMYEAIDQLNSDDDDFYQKMSQIKTDTEDTIQADRETVNKAKRDTEADKEAEGQRVYDEAIQGAKKAGLDMKTGVSKDDDGNPINSLDYDLFWDCTGRAQGKTFEERLEWTVEEVNRIKGVINADTKDLQEKAKKKQKENKVLETGTKKIPGTKDEDEKPLSVMDAFEKNRRTL